MCIADRISAARAVFAAVAALLLAAPGIANAQVAPLEHETIEISLDTDWVTNRGRRRSVVASQVVQSPGASWVRLRFDLVELGRPRQLRARPTVIRITSLLDGATQELDRRALEEWRDTSAYFNGDSVLVQIIADPSAGPSRLSARSLMSGIGDEQSEHGQRGSRSLCGDDDRVLSSDPRCGRTSNGCTAWLIDDSERCMLTAGHCDGEVGDDLDVVMFNVPLSMGNGTIVLSDPEDQYPVDPASIQSTGEGDPGQEFTYFGVFPNTETGLTPAEAQGDFFVRADPDEMVIDTVRVTGYGATSPPVSGTWNQAQKTHTGPYVILIGAKIEHEVDTTSGNSGSPIIDEDTGLAIGIHTHGGCDVETNAGSSMMLNALQDAFDSPLGVCMPEIIPPPANDDCANAIAIFDGETEFDTTSATLDGPLTLGDCNVNGDAQVRADIWYTYVATCTDVLTISTCGAADFNTKIAVYEGDECPDHFNDPIFACEDDTEGCAGGTTEIVTSVAVTEGETYLIRLGGWQAETGTGTLTLTCGDPPPACPGDANADLIVNVSDLLVVINNWGDTQVRGELEGDLNDDDVVNVSDLLIVINNWGTNCGD